MKRIGQDWAQWRGPQRNGVSKETGLLKEWPKDGPKLLWQRSDIGYGFSTPAISDGRLYFQSNTGLDNEFVQMLGARDGKKGWTARLGKVGNPDQQPNYPGARSTPTRDRGDLFALGSDGDLVCLNALTGAIRWRRHLRTDFGGESGTWAYSESPLVDDDRVICTPGGSQATVVALRRTDGSPLWKTAVPGGEQAGYASPVLATIGGVRQYVTFLQKGVVGIAARDGKLLWRYETTARGSAGNIPTPVVFDNLVYSSTTMTGGGLARIVPRDGGFATEEIYFSRKLPNAIGGAVKVGEYLYGASGQVLMCVDFRTGKAQWDDRSVGPGSLCAAEGNLYVHGENGEVALVEASPSGYKEKGRFTPPGAPERARTRAWAYPAIAQGRLYIRDLNALWCYQIAE